ncbi:MAG TPA: alpha/beta fold hydrolase [Vicinamibacterales bacterium]
MRRIPIVLAILLVAFATPTPAQETNRFRSRVGTGTVSGTEEFTIVRTAAGYDVSATIAMKRGAAGTAFTLRESLTPDWTPEKYAVEMSGAMGAASVSADRKGEILALAVKTPAGAPAKDLPIKPQLVLMDNMLATPYQILLNLTGGKPGPVAVIVPFQLMPLDGALQAAGTVQGTLDGKPISATKLLFAMAGVQMEILFDAATSRLLRVYVPMQDAEIVREGFTIAGAATPEAAPPAGVTEREISFASGDGQIFPTLLCVPRVPKPAPMVVFIQGSGPQDRDETIGPNKPFRDLAWGLAERGVASLRFDKRTHAFPNTYKGTLDSESIDDAVAAVKFAQTLAEVDKDRIFVLGHSLGGLAAPYVAERAPVRGLILMAAPGRNMEQVIREQVLTLNAVLPAEKQKEALKLQDSIMAKARAGTATAEELNGLPPGAVRDMIVREPIAELQKTKVPILVLKGGKDAQVFQADFDALQSLAASRPGSAAKLFPNLTHIFTVNDGPPDFRAIFQPGHVAVEVIEMIAGWVVKM